MTNKQPWECPEKYLKELREVKKRIEDWGLYNSKKSHFSPLCKQISEEELSELNIEYLSAPKYQKLKELKFLKSMGILLNN